MRRIVALLLFATAAQSAFAFVTFGTKWGLGPGLATHLKGHEGTPGFITWSFMGSGLPIMGFPGAPDPHGGLLTSEIGMLLGGPTDAEETAAITSAFASWSAVAGISVLGPIVDSGAPGGGPETSGAHIADIRIAAIGGFTFPSELAHAYGPGTEDLFGTGGTIMGDLHFNIEKDWVDDPDDPDDGVFYDFETVALHELGHSLGLLHSDVEGSVMFGEYEGGKRDLTPDDIAGMSFIYGVPEPATMVALGIGVALLARRRRK